MPRPGSRYTRRMRRSLVFRSTFLVRTFVFHVATGFASRRRRISAIVRRIAARPLPNEFTDRPAGRWLRTFYSHEPLLWADLQARLRAIRSDAVGTPLRR